MNDIGAAMDKVENKLYSEEKEESSSEGKKYYKYRTSDVAAYLAKGDTQSAAYVTQELIKSYEENGKTADSAKQSIRSYITKQFKENYCNGSDTEREQIRQLMWASGAHKNGYGVVSATQYWLKN